uniref:Amino acid transporter transmembrane domain-containing protein n=1 Tax=Ciona savignyi TaxID=51511 RepID=H2ZQ92_CIOSA
MTLVASLYLTVGVVGYLKYGSSICGSITLNLLNTDPLAQTVKILYSCTILCRLASAVLRSHAATNSMASPPVVEVG